MDSISFELMVVETLPILNHTNFVKEVIRFDVFCIL